MCNTVPIFVAFVLPQGSRGERPRGMARSRPRAGDGGGGPHRGATVADSLVAPARRYPTPVSPVATGVRAVDRPPTVRGVGTAAAGSANSRPPAGRRLLMGGEGMRVAAEPATAALPACRSGGCGRRSAADAPPHRVYGTTPVVRSSVTGSRGRPPSRSLVPHSTASAATRIWRGTQ